MPDINQWPKNGLSSPKTNKDYWFAFTQSSKQFFVGSVTFKKSVLDI